MKNIVLLLVLFFITNIYSQDIDPSKLVIIPESYDNHEGKPRIAHKDSIYQFLAPDVHLVNTKAFTAMKKVFLSTLEKDQMTQDLIEKYSETISRNIELERMLKNNFQSIDSLDLKAYQRTKTALSDTQKSLDYTVKSLEKANESLKLIEKNTKRQRRKSAFEKILFTIAGVGAGVLVGVSL